MNETRQRNLSLESLEPRLQLAGGLVTAVLVDGDMVITGDSVRNSLTLQPSWDRVGNPVPGAITVFGNNGTEVNFPGRDRAYFDDFQGDIRITLPNGGYQVKFRQLGFEYVRLAIPGDIRFVAGGKNSGPESRLNFDGVDVAGDVFVKTNRGTNFVSFDDSEFAGSVTAITERGYDHVSATHCNIAGDFKVTGVLGKGPAPKKIGVMDQNHVWHSQVGGDVNVKGIPRGKSKTLLYDAQVSGALIARPGPAIDRLNAIHSDLGQVRVNTGGGADRLRLENCTVDRVFANLGAGSDVVSLQDTTVQTSVEIATLQGSDIVGAMGLDVGGDFQLDTGPGPDVVYLGTDPSEVPESSAGVKLYYQTQTPAVVGLAANAVAVVTGDGRDWIGVEDCHFRSTTKIYGGNDGDQIFLEGSQLDGLLWIDAGAGSDVMECLGCQVTSHVRAFAGDGNDRFKILGSDIGRSLKVRMDSGRDTLIARSNEVATLTEFWGGSGFDVLDESDNDFGSPPDVREFEDVN